MASERATRRDAAGTRLLAALLLLAGSTACFPSGPGTDPDAGFVDTFADFTRPTLADVDAFEDLAVVGPSSRSVKFVLTGFDSAAPNMRWMDGGAYSLHDEWYWFRLLNGARIPDLPPSTHPAEQPQVGSFFPSVDAVYQWARRQRDLPLDLRFVGDRLYSPRFYELALYERPTKLRAGTLVRFPAREDPPRDEMWAFELEYSDPATHDEIVKLFRAIERTAPPEVRDRIAWLARSPAQEALAAAMADEGLAYGDRVLRYADLAVAGDVEVYSEGLVAGRLRVVRAGAGLAETRATDILVVDQPPDFLPQCSGLLTAVPQTPLAHVNVLAKNRGIPNAYVAGLLDDPNVDQLAGAGAPVVVRARAPDDLELVPMSEDDFALWRQMTAPRTSAVDPIDVDALPYVVDLEELSFADADDVRGYAGGKAAGFTALGDADVERPPDALALTIKAYVEHTADLRPRLQAMLADPAFQASPAIRILALEGEGFYDATFPTEDARREKEDLLASRGDGDPLAGLIRAGGVRAIVETRAIDATTAATIRAALEERFGGYADAQPLRFRSSSNVEDIEGFNGAGLYESSTGFLRAELLADPDDQARTVERAIRATWGSYWRAEAFEERALERIDHLSGAMGVLVHAGFQDSHERSNGVLFVTVLPPEHDDAARMELNVQAGALSVTNPDGTTELPEVDVVAADRAGGLRVERVRGSTLLPDGVYVVTDAELLDLYAQARSVVDLWLAAEGEGLLAAQKPRTLTLDMEVRGMEEGWPALANGNVFGRRIVLKQARTVEPSTARVPAAVLSQPIPRDVIARARRVERTSCVGPTFSLAAIEAYTDPLAAPDLGYTRAPFTGVVTVELVQDVAGIGAAGSRLSAVHLSYAATHPSLAAGGAWDLDVQVAADRADATGFTRATIEADGAMHLSHGAVVVDDPAGSAACTVELMHSTPQEFLASLLD